MHDVDGQGVSGPTFQVMEERPPRVLAFLLAVLTSAVLLGAIVFGVRHSRTLHRQDTASHLTRDPSHAAKQGKADEDKDDPSQVDTIYLGDAADAPVPATHGGHASRVHPTIIVRLPRFGPSEGLIPNTDAGHQLYRWLAAFNQANASALKQVLPSHADANATAAAQLQLRQQTGGFRLLSAKEIQPGLIVFRLEDQLPANNEALGSLQLLLDSSPPAIGSFSLRGTEPEQSPLPAH